MNSQNLCGHRYFQEEATGAEANIGLSPKELMVHLWKIGPLPEVSMVGMKGNNSPLILYALQYVVY